MKCAWCHPGVDSPDGHGICQRHRVQVLADAGLLVCATCGAQFVPYTVPRYFDCKTGQLLYDPERVEARVCRDCHQERGAFEDERSP